MRVGTSCLPSITGGTDYNFKASLDFAGVLAATRICITWVMRVTTFGTLPQSIQGQPNSRWTTSLGITLAQPHAVVRASPILAGTGSYSLTRQGISLKPYSSIRCSSGRATSGALPCMSPCRWDHILARCLPCLRRMASEDSCFRKSFLLIVRTRRIVTAQTQ